jgi:membrane-bound lytic murein transglycosylase B
MPVRVPRLILAFAIACACAGVPAALVAQAPAPALPSVPFSEWLAQLRQDALAKGISERTVEAALSNIEPVPVVVERDRTQAERTLSIDQYLKRRLDRKTVKTAREMAKRHAGVLAKVSAQYGVPPGIIVAVWGLESNFGRFSGVRPTIASLATLAYDNRRAAMFREELFSALRILDRGDIDLSQMKGSWAGAMGQPQFMPSSYLKYAEDFDRDGRRDIWGSEADVFASIANYLKQAGWTTGAGWGRAVTLSKQAMAKVESAAPLRTAGCEATRQMTEGLSWSRWRALGVRPAGRQAFPKSNGAASLVRAGTRSFLVLDNYAVLLQYNCAHAYALAVALLADQIPAARTHTQSQTLTPGPR